MCKKRYAHIHTHSSSALKELGDVRIFGVDNRAILLPLALLTRLAARRTWKPTLISFYSLLQLPSTPLSPHLLNFRAGMLQRVMFTSTSKAIRCEPQGLRWVCRPSHLRQTSPKHLASSCHNSIQVHFGLTLAPPLLVEVIPDYRATVVKCWYNVFFLFFSPLSLFAQLFSNSSSSHVSSLVWLTLGKTDISLRFNALGKL